MYKYLDLLKYKFVYGDHYKDIKKYDMKWGKNIFISIRIIIIWRLFLCSYFFLYFLENFRKITFIKPYIMSV